MSAPARYAVLVAGRSRRREDIAMGREPRRDYLDLADALGARLIQCGSGPRGGLTAGLLAAWTAFRRRNEYDVLVTDAELSGLPLAFLFMLTRKRRGHVMISHWLRPAKKRIPFQWLSARGAIDRLVVYSSAQERYAVEQLKVPRRTVEKVLHAPDAQFWHPLGGPRSGICAAGMERRDYATLVEAVRGLELTLTIAAAGSPWTKRDPLTSPNLPRNVIKVRLDYLKLRDLYDRSEFVVIPLHDVDFQAGSVVMYEAMAMGKAVIASRTRSHRNGDILRDGETGLLVPPGDARAMREAIIRLHEDPAEAQRLGANARRIVEQGLNHEAYVLRMAQIAREVAAEVTGRDQRSSQVPAAAPSS